MTLKLLSALGIVLAFEGLIYALLPGQMKNLMAQIKDMSTEHLRVFGTVALALGVVLIWLAGGALPD